MGCSRPAEIADLRRRQAEEEEVLFTRLLADFDVGAVQCADGDGPIHHELHAPGAACLEAGGGDLLGEVGSRIDALPQRDGVVGKEDDLQKVFHLGIVIDQLAHLAYQLDDELRHRIAGRSFSSEEERARREVFHRAALDLAVQRKDVQCVQVLAFVLVQPFYLHIEHRRRVHIDGHRLLDVCGEPALGSFLRLAPAIEEAPVAGEALQRLQPIQILVPICADGLVDQSGKFGIGEHQPAPGRDAIGLVAESFREGLVVVVQGSFFQQLQCAVRRRR